MPHLNSGLVVKNTLSQRLPARPGAHGSLIRHGRGGAVIPRIELATGKKRNAERAESSRRDELKLTMR